MNIAEAICCLMLVGCVEYGPEELTRIDVDLSNARDGTSGALWGDEIWMGSGGGSLQIPISVDEPMHLSAVSLVIGAHPAADLKVYVLYYDSNVSPHLGSEILVVHAGRPRRVAIHPDLPESRLPWWDTLVVLPSVTDSGRVSDVAIWAK